MCSILPSESNGLLEATPGKTTLVHVNCTFQLLLVLDHGKANAVSGGPFSRVVGFEEKFSSAPDSGF